MTEQTISIRGVSDGKSRNGESEASARAVGRESVAQAGSARNTANKPQAKAAPVTVEPSTSMDGYLTFVNAIMSDDIDTFSRPEFEEYAFAAVFAYAMSRPKGAVRPAKMAQRPEAQKKVLDLVMANSCGTESLELSLSRLATACGSLGFERVSAFSAWCAYKVYGKELSTKKEFRNVRKQWKRVRADARK